MSRKASGKHLEADQLQQQESTSGSSRVSREQEPETAANTDAGQLKIRKTSPGLEAISTCPSWTLSEDLDVYLYELTRLLVDWMLHEWPGEQHDRTIRQTYRITIFKGVYMIHNTYKIVTKKPIIFKKYLNEKNNPHLLCVKTKKERSQIKK